jgi:hypothetical protein
MAFQFACRKWLSHKDLEPAGSVTNIRLRLRCSFRLFTFGYVLKDALEFILSVVEGLNATDTSCASV